jgi:TolA-binding protein
MGRAGRRVALIFAAMLSVGVAGCWTTKQQGAALRRDMDSLQEKLVGDLRRSKLERQKLQKVMEQATALLTRNSADVGAQVDRLQAKMDLLSGQIDELQKKHDDLSQQFTEFKAKVDVKMEGLTNNPPQNKPPAVPLGKSELFQLASRKLTAGQHQEARKLLRHFTSRFPSDSRALKAQLMLGDSYFAEQKFAPAIVEYKKIIEKHKNSREVPDALYKIGMSFYQLKFCADAQLFLSQLLKRKGRHPQVKRAKKVLALIKRHKRNRKLCRP